VAYRRKYLLDCEIAEAKAKEGKWKWMRMGGWKPLTIGLWAAGLALLFGAVALAVMLVPDGPPIMAPPAVPREEFRKSVVGKTRDEVTQAHGPPPKSGADFLYYSWLSSDPSTGKADKHIMVMFDERTGRCVNVKFTP
jgi:hypothetical protein